MGRLHERSEENRTYVLTEGSPSDRARTMRRLTHQQPVEVHLDGEDEIVVPCRVVRVEGSVATLESADGDPVLVGNTAPALPGYLVFDHAGGRVALKGIAAPDANENTELLFVV